MTWVGAKCVRAKVDFPLPDTPTSTTSDIAGIPISVIPLLPSPSGTVVPVAVSLPLPGAVFSVIPPPPA
ncbi:hypothetical protein Plo01_30330 [Planobispora longispora]|uniref:Uncharacterized protein n=1 Tax=Planobispora longispora TaxID=28887 RepID=A0A8J3RKH4_9ACTN|nr:hypothetical protein Plo01_30330 [Planobispora longispora]